MCVGENDSAAFIRRRLAAQNYMQQLLEQGELSAQESVQATTNKFNLNANIRDDYRIYQLLWGMAAGI